MATLWFKAYTLKPVEEIDPTTMQIVLMDAMHEYIEKRKNVEAYANIGKLYPGEDLLERMAQVQFKVDTAQSITNLFMIPEKTQYEPEEERAIGLKEREKIRAFPTGRMTEAEALYVYRRHEALSNGGYVIDSAREWWRSIDAIAPSWLTGMDLNSGWNSDS